MQAIAHSSRLEKARLVILENSGLLIYDTQNNYARYKMSRDQGALQ